MQNYLLVLIVVLIIVIVGILYLGNRELNKTKVLLNKLQNDVSAIQSALTHINTKPHFTPQQMNYFMDQHHDNEPTEEELHNLMQTQVLHSNEHDYEDGSWEEEIEQEEEGIEELEEEHEEEEHEEEHEEEEHEEEEHEEEEHEHKEEQVELFEPEIIETKKPSSKKSTPNLKPSDYETGHKVVSENDGQTYEVVESKNGRKRWKKTSDVVEDSELVEETSEVVEETTQEVKETNELVEETTQEVETLENWEKEN